MRPQRLTADDLTSGLLQISSWTKSGEAISRAIVYPSFLTAIEAVNRIATVAEEADHHPDIDIRWRSLHLTLTTHDVGGLTELDLDLAGKIDAITDELGGSASP